MSGEHYRAVAGYVGQGKAITLLALETDDLLVPASGEMLGRYVDLLPGVYTMPPRVWCMNKLMIVEPISAGETEFGL